MSEQHDRSPFSSRVSFVLLLTAVLGYLTSYFQHATNLSAENICKILKNVLKIVCILQYCMNTVIAILCCIWVCCVVSALCSGAVSLALRLYVAVELETLVMLKSF